MIAFDVKFDGIHLPLIKIASSESLFDNLRKFLTWIKINEKLMIEKFKEERDKAQSKRHYHIDQKKETSN